MRNQWIMAAGVKRRLSHHEWPAWRQAWWMKSQPSLAARSCLRVLRVVEIRRCIAGPPGPWSVRKIPLCTGVPLFSRDEAAWGYRCLNAIQDGPRCSPLKWRLMPGAAECPCLSDQAFSLLLRSLEDVRSRSQQIRETASGSLLAEAGRSMRRGGQHRLGDWPTPVRRTTSARVPQTRPIHVAVPEALADADG